MNEKEIIKNKFIKFEPEVDDLVINQKWEKIKYFVPQKEKKKRGIFFFLLVGSALFIAGLVGTLLYNSFNEDTIVYRSNKTQEFSNSNNKTLSENTVQQNGLTQISGATNNYNSTTHDTLVSNYKTNNFSAKETNFKKGNSTDQIQNSDLVTTIISENNLFADTLQQLQVPFFITETGREIYPELKNNYYFPKLSSPLSIDVFGGSGLSYSQRVQHMGFTQKNNDIGYLAGIAINYHLRNRFTISAQFIFDKANLNYSYVTSQNKITKQVISISSTPSSAQFDSTYYIKAFTDQIIRANYACHFALGAEYLLLKKNKLSLSASAQFNVCYTKYDYGYTQHYGKEVFLYIKGQPNPPSANIAPAYFKEGDYFETTDVINLGVLPGAVLGYSISNKMSVIFKPSYFIGFSKNKLLINSASYPLKEDRMFLNAGLRFKL